MSTKVVGAKKGKKSRVMPGMGAMPGGFPNFN